MVAWSERLMCEVEFLGGVVFRERCFGFFNVVPDDPLPYYQVGVLESCIFTLGPIC